VSVLPYLARWTQTGDLVIVHPPTVVCPKARPESPPTLITVNKVDLCQIT
jgi:hypothetical protein